MDWILSTRYSTSTAKISLNILMFIIVNWWEGRDGRKEGGREKREVGETREEEGRRGKEREREGVNESINACEPHCNEKGRP